jgi:hypothetical protein
MILLLLAIGLSWLSVLGVIGINYAFSIGISGSNGTRINGSFTETGTTSIDISRNLPAGSTNVLVAAAWTVANTQAIFLVSSSNMTLKTNSSSAPGNTIYLTANVPLIWDASAGYYPNPFTTNVTAFYCTCSAAALLQGSILTT